MKNILEELLKIGGRKVMLPGTISDDFLVNATVMDNKVLCPVGGLSRYYLSNEDKVTVMSGFVLDENEIWKLHSWLLLNDRNVILDEKEYIKYYGFIK